MNQEELKIKLRKVDLAHKIINSKFFSDNVVTILCVELGFCDTAFREKKQEDKLKDYLLSKNYWIERFRKSIFPNPPINLQEAKCEK